MPASTPRIALYVGNPLYPANNEIPWETIQILQLSPLTSPILGMLNHNNNSDTLVFNDNENVVFDNQGRYKGAAEWPAVVAELRSERIREVYISFSTSGTDWLAGLLKSDYDAAMSILSFLKYTLRVDGIDLDYESDTSPGSKMYPVARAAVTAGLKLTAAPYLFPKDWNAWVKEVMGEYGGKVSWLNLQCYAGGKANNPGDWNFIGVPIVAGSCKSCSSPHTTCTPQDMQDLFTLWRTGEGSVSKDCWDGPANDKPQEIGGGFIWAYSAIAGKEFLPYMDAIKKGLGM